MSFNCGTHSTQLNRLPPSHEGEAPLATTQSRMDSDEEHAKTLTPTETKDKKHKKKKKKKKDELVKAKIEVVREEQDKIGPVVGYFPSGFDPISDGAAATGFHVYRNRRTRKRMQLVVGSPASPVEYVGTSYAGEAAAGNSSMYAIGVFDKEKGTLKVVPVAANKIFRLEPKVKALDAVDKEPATSTVEELTPLDWAVKQRQITNLFGTKKEITKTKKRLALTQDDDPESQKNLDVKMENVDVNKLALEGTESQVARNIPPCNLSATSPQEAYVLDQIILKGEWGYLEDIYYILLKEEEADFSSYPTFVSNRINKLKNIKDDSEKRKHSCILSFISHLVSFKEQNSFRDNSTKKRLKIPNILRNRFSAMFGNTSGSNSKWLSSEKISLLVCYILVLTLFFDEFETDYCDIARDLKMSQLVVKQHYEHLGCKVKRKNNANHATLPVPLKFPGVRQKKRKR
ncbi:hypothetical protein Ahy_A04g020347 isoform B [Arachis hypogaea]|uniref:DNA-directed RNA polymerase I subunit rpa49 n=1 Tax=Arachis hypogaea TaxID=3818 RepID=A0A445DHP3_ARAHY|nr:hypothetical protein Ahy_A04g020347 isoform B [Arachis hypogaea]